MDAEKTSKGLSNKDLMSLSSTQKLLQYIDKYRQRFPKAAITPELIFTSANTYYNAERYNDAIPVYRQIVSDYPQYKDAAKASRMLGQCYVFIKEYDKAITLYQTLLSK
ncbi:hypothetical protein LDC_0898, partial [sediment metagenome]